MPATVTSRAFNQNTSRAKKAAEAGPVIITDRGRPAHVLVTYADYEKLVPNQKKSIAELLAMSEGADVGVEFPRLNDLPREIDWSWCTCSIPRRIGDEEDIARRSERRCRLMGVQHRRR